MSEQEVRHEPGDAGFRVASVASAGMREAVHQSELAAAGRKDEWG